MGHGHSHGPGGHHHGTAGNRAENRRRLSIVLGLTALYLVAEVIGGFLTNSLALLADAGHMLSDVAALALSLFAMRMAQKPATAQRTYGFYRVEILAALANAALLIAVSFYICVEGYQRFFSPPEVQGLGVMGVAFGGLVVNLIGLYLLHGGQGESLNVRGAWLHMVSDALGSVGAIISGVLIWVYDWKWADPAASILIALLVLYSAWGLLRETLAVLMEGAPGHLDVDEVRNAIQDIEGVQSVHDLHVWSITSGMVALSVHVAAGENVPQRELLSTVRRQLHDRFGIHHSTIQIETEGFGHCEGC